MDHAFGGTWTEAKLACLAKYLAAYRAIFSANERARHFRTWYVDAFAGTGARTEPEVPERRSLFGEIYAETKGYRDGSARIALQLSKPFDRYLFVEQSQARIAELQSAVDHDFEKLLPRCDFKTGDANTLLKEWCSERDWRKERAVVFLDPYGMQVDWSTIAALGATKGVDLWYLFPLGIGPARLMRHDGNISDGWKKRLTALFGTEDWYEHFYRRRQVRGLFDDEEFEVAQRDAPPEKISAFIQERLATCFAKVANGLILYNSKSSPLYLLCFAAANAKAAPVALRIAQSILTD